MAFELYVLIVFSVRILCWNARDFFRAGSLVFAVGISYAKR